jgi:hypothetical protein
LPAHAVRILPLSVAAGLVVITGHQWCVNKAASANSRLHQIAIIIAVKMLNADKFALRDFGSTSKQAGSGAFDYGLSILPALP